LEKTGLLLTLGMAAILLVEALLLHKREDAREADAIGDELQPAELDSSELVLLLLFCYERPHGRP
jgi:hypothetical protein